MRVAIAAFACRPHGGSETGVGWAVAKGAADLGHAVVLFTQPRHRSALEDALHRDRDLAARIRPVYVGLPAPLMERWERHFGLRGLQVYNLAWQGLLRARVRRMHRKEPFDLAHHVTLSTDWIPTGLAFIEGLPVVWGPLGGSERVPRSCRPYLSPRGRLVERARSWTADPMRAAVGAAAARRCALLVAQNDEEASRLRDLGPPVVIRPNVFLEDDFGTAPDDRSQAPPVREDAPRAVFAGRLVAWKGVYLALSVLTRPEMASWHLDVFGAGPERGRLLRKIRRLGLEERVVLHGKRPRDEVESALRCADAFLFPSMREAAGWVVAEALAVGCPVICLDSAGPPLLLRGTGVAVPPGPTMVEDLARALTAARSGPRTVVRWDQSEAPAVLREWYAYPDCSETVASHRVNGALTQ